MFIKDWFPFGEQCEQKCCCCCCEYEGVGGQEIGLVEEELGAGAEIAELARLVMLPDVK